MLGGESSEDVLVKTKGSRDRAPSPTSLFASQHARVFPCVGGTACMCAFWSTLLLLRKVPIDLSSRWRGYVRIRGCWFCSACEAPFFIQRERRQSTVWLSPLERPSPTSFESVQVGEQLVAGHYGASPAIGRRSPPSAPPIAPTLSRSKKVE